MSHKFNSLFDEKIPEVRKMPLVFGGQVRLEDIVGRDKLIERVIYDLNNTSIIINEIRRFGKTSFLRLLESKAPDNWICVNTTVQGAFTTAKLIEITLQNILNQARAREKIKKTIFAVGHAVKNAKLNLNGFEFALGKEYEADALSTFRAVLGSIGKQLIKDKKIMVIIWDEFPDAIQAILKKEGKDAANEIMKFFRAMRENKDSQSIRWVLTGSIGMHHIFREFSGSDTINDMATVSLDPLESRYIRWMSVCLLLEINRNTDGSDYLADASGGIPFVLEMMIKYIRDFDASVPQSVKDAESLLIEAASEINLGKNWTPLLERVGSYYGENAKTAEAVLDIIAMFPVEDRMIGELLRKRAKKPVNENTLDVILTLLLNDHYLKYDNASRLYAWKHEPLRIIWKARRRKGL